MFIIINFHLMGQCHQSNGNGNTKSPATNLILPTSENTEIIPEKLFKY